MMRSGIDSVARWRVAIGAAAALSAGVFIVLTMFVAGRHGSTAGAALRDVPLVDSIVGMAGHQHPHRTFDVYGVDRSDGESLRLFDTDEDAQGYAVDAGSTPAVVRYAAYLAVTDSGLWAETTRRFTIELGADAMDDETNMDLADQPDLHEPAVERLLAELEPFADQYGVQRPAPDMLHRVTESRYLAAPDASLAFETHRSLYGGYAINTLSALSALAAIVGVAFLLRAPRSGGQH